MFIFQTHCVSVLNMSQPPTPGSPVGARENGLLQAYFENLGQFAFDKARDIMVRNLVSELMPNYVVHCILLQ